MGIPGEGMRGSFPATVFVGWYNGYPDYRALDFDLSHERVVHSTSGEPRPGEYCVGWSKRGPSGVIGTNKPDAASTVAAMVAALAELPGIPDDHRDPDRIIALLRERKPGFVTFDQWKMLDAHEIARGAEQGRPHIKVTSVPEMLEVIRQG